MLIPQGIKYFLSVIAVIVTMSLVAFSAHAVQTTNFQLEIIPSSQCSDGGDNDGDSLIDFPSDPGCDSPTDNDETDNLTACEDGIDNDGDLLIDMADPGCSGPLDDDETNVFVAPPSSGGGGGGGGANIITKQLTFSGRASPNAEVTVLQDAQEIVKTIASPRSNFTFDVPGLTTGNYLFSFISKDTDGVRSRLFTVPVQVTDAGTASFQDIVIPPTITTSKRQVQQNGLVAISGQSIPDSEVVLKLVDQDVDFPRLPISANGRYNYEFSTAGFELGSYYVQSKVVRDGEFESDNSQLIEFKIAGIDILNDVDQEGLRGDFNGDGRVNIIDFSIMAFWYQRVGPPDNIDLTTDTLVDLRDFSILAFYWTG